MAETETVGDESQDDVYTITGRRKPQCPECNQVFSCRSGLHRHRKRKHGLMPAMLSGRSDIKCCICGAIFTTYKAYAIHANTHSKKCTVFIKTFSDVQKYEEWKSLEEEKTMTQFSRNTGSTPMPDGSFKDFFRCHRTGAYKNSVQSTRKRKLKSQGSCKMGGYCPVYLMVVKHPDGHVEVEGCLGHLGHRLQLRHLRLRSSERQHIEDQLVMGVPVTRVLGDIRNGILDGEDASGIGLQRHHLTNIRDIKNIAAAVVRKRLVPDVIMDEDEDSESFNKWIEKELRKENGIITIYKESGAELDEMHPQISKDDFLLGVMTSVQAESLVEFGQNKIVCLDVTRKRRKREYHVITVLVVDEFGDGFPVASFISNRDDHDTLVVLFRSLRKRLGTSLVPAYIMTDDEPQYFSAWKAAFGENGEQPRKLLCAWHLDRIWRKTLQLQVKDSNERNQVYERMTKLREFCGLKENFKKQLDTFLFDLRNDEYTTRFASYFATSFANRASEWASVFHTEGGVTTDVHFDAFHKVLEYCDRHLKGFINKRLHNPAKLIQFVRDRSFGLLRQREVNQASARLQMISDGHNAARHMGDVHVATSDKLTYTIYNAEEECQVTLVSQETTSYCHEDECQLRCDLCGSACVHRFRCTCADYSISVMCKHIHILIKLLASIEGRHEEHDYANCKGSAGDSRESYVVFGEDAADQVKCANEIPHEEVVIDSSEPEVVCPADVGEETVKKRSRCHALLNEVRGLIDRCTDLKALESMVKRFVAARTILSYGITDSVSNKVELQKQASVSDKVFVSADDPYMEVDAFTTLNLRNYKTHNQSQMIIDGEVENEADDGTVIENVEILNETETSTLDIEHLKVSLNTIPVDSPDGYTYLILEGKI